MQRILVCFSILVAFAGLFLGQFNVKSQSGRVLSNATNVVRPAVNVPLRSNSRSKSSTGGSRRQIVEQMLVDGIVDSKDMNDQPFTIDGLVNEITFRSADLNGDGVAEFIVEGSFSMGVCGSSGCVSWIYERKGNMWRQIIGEPTNGSISVKKIKTKGYFDLQLATQSGAYDQLFHSLKFDGEKYRESSCIEHNYIDANGNIMKRPRISKC